MKLLPPEGSPFLRSPGPVGPAGPFLSQPCPLVENLGAASPPGQAELRYHLYRSPGVLAPVLARGVPGTVRERATHP